MKKRIVSVITVLMILLTGLTACGKEVEKPLPKDKVSVVDEFVRKHPNFNGPDKEPGLFSLFSGNLVKSVDVCEGTAVMEWDCTTAVNTPFEIPFNTEEYAVIAEHGFSKVVYSPLSTFSADVDTASYSNVRRMIEAGYRLSDIPKGAVRTEEFINYFNYDYKLPKAGEPFGVTTELGDCPWNPDTKLLSIGIKTEKIDFSEAGNSNIVFLIDVSGSMFSENKLPLLVKSFKLMLEELGEKDRVSIVTYAGEDKILLEGVPASEKEKINDVLDSLEANGCTNGGQGIISAYRLAEKNFIKGGNNRVILATDGDLNVGITSASDLEELIKKESKSGIFLTVLGFGMGNYSDERLETLADSGNGNFAYIDTITEAKKVLCEELGATMVTVAKDVKFQVEFNPAVVAEYRLIGYEDRTLAAEDFENDAKDAGEIGAGHTVTALYEIVTIDNYDKTGSGLKYQDATLSDAALAGEWLTVNIRYKEPTGDTSKLLSFPVGNEDYKEKNSDSFLFAASVAEFAQVLRGEEYVGDLSLDDILKNLKKTELNDVYKVEFENLVKAMAKSTSENY